MNILIVGSGGREHALCHFIKKSDKVKEIYCIPGNAGTNLIANNISLSLDNFENLKKFIQKKDINLVVIGPEKPLVDGIVDYLESNQIKVFGPNKIASKLEGSKIFTKDICKKYKIPTAKFGVYEDKVKATKFLNDCEYPIVIKADGLAAGKGVYICEKKDDAEIAVQEIFAGKFGKAKQILFEEFLKGEEMSFFIISDGKSFKSFSTAQDHKRLEENDMGPNTGGMGAYSPSKHENTMLNEKIINKIIKPTLLALKEMGEEFKGFLYAGLMIYNNEPYLIEYNVRMGDPECQTILPRLKTDLLEIIEAAVNQKLSLTNIEWSNKKSLCIVLCSKGYPGKYQNELEIKGIEKLKTKDNQFIFHAGTKSENLKILSNGGRVLNFVTLSDEFKESRNQALELINQLNWENGFYRSDIGHKVIKE